MINVFNQQKVDTTDSRFFDASIFDVGYPGRLQERRRERPLQAVQPVHRDAGGRGQLAARAEIRPRPTNPFGYQTPRTYTFTAGVRF